MESKSVPLSRAEQEYRLRVLQAEIKKTRKAMQEISKDMEREKKRIHISKILAAGRVIEEAGILDDYIESELYFLLVMNKDYLTNHKPTNDSGNFDMMHGLSSVNY